MGPTVAAAELCLLDVHSAGGPSVVAVTGENDSARRRTEGFGESPLYDERQYAIEYAYEIITDATLRSAGLPELQSKPTLLSHFSPRRGTCFIARVAPLACLPGAHAAQQQCKAPPRLALVASTVWSPPPPPAQLSSRVLVSLGLQIQRPSRFIAKLRNLRGGAVLPLFKGARSPSQLTSALTPLQQLST